VTNSVMLEAASKRFEASDIEFQSLRI
jgi:hypothetical protein